ncbi:MAG: polymer-forming cytoskeletal protein [Acidobacteriota bacterium]|nr:polymer-forming cytoskeletal protein [Acidobacteriota bacterium]
MIRMGRSNSSKPEPMKSEIPQKDFSTPNQSFGYTPQMSETASFRPSFETASSQRGAMTDSESMARDIKEGRLSGFVGSGTTLTGETTFKAVLRVDGHMTGRVMSETGTLIIGTGGQVDANITVAAAIIHGIVNGDIVATERVELGRTAKLVGNIQTPSLSIEQGAIFEGNCSMIRQKAEMDKRAAQNVQPESYSNGKGAAEAQNDVENKEKIVTKNAA